MWTLATPTAATLDPANPKPGIYSGVPFDVYVSINALNHSSLKKIAQSPAHYLWATQHPEENKETDSKRLGTAEHCLLLEPDRFERDVIPGPINPKTGRAYSGDTQAFAKYVDENPGKIIVSDEEMSRLRGMAASAMAHPLAGKILSAPGDNEITMIWQDEQTGLVCKGRVDARRPELGLRVDIKTCEDGSEPGMARAMVNYGYETAAAFYARGAEALGIAGETHVLLCIESAGPFAIGVYRVADETFKIGAQRVSEWMATLKKCMDTNHWPAYSDRIVDLEAPGFYLTRWSNGEF